MDAAVNAVKKIISKPVTLTEFTIQGVSKGSDDTCKVHMQVEHGGGMYYGFGCSTDIVAASIEAYVDALNKFSAV